ncbi:N-acetylmuramoyl-L-alanine amidase [uncultured Gemella sp.]|uniref:N-acetylmuramoyl-L-alanine amidase n=1 Tax=uncultured Gemella sp. TaxID=254352 RepID=UPI0028D23A73|nr:N-acetylmuramoyl-L-alanine amidase [uncultured Gemella sp.]
MKKNRLKLGLGVLTVLATPIAVNTVASNDALAAQGWVKSGNTWYFYNKNGTLARNAWAGNYWLGADGKMVTNAWVDNGRYYVGSNGEWVKNAQKPAATTTNTAKQGWVQSGASWYYLDANGSVVRNAWIGNYWLGTDGRMATSSWVDNGRYYVGSNGLWVQGAKKPAEKKQGWVKSGSDWYYFDQNGTLVRNKWAGNYWLGTDGRMATSSWVDNGRYYVGSTGLWDKNAKKQEEKKQGWVKSGSDWYYYENGTLVRNKWAGNYWLGADGRMATSSWVDNGRYYVGSTGLWDKNAKKQEVSKPAEKKQGWVKSGSDWYYYDDNGTLARNKWAGNYWLGTDGKMATNSWVDNGRYYVGSNGAWVKDASRDKNTKRSIFLDPGHGGSDTGAISQGVREKDLTLSVYNKVSSKLASLGFTVLTSRTTDKDVDLVDRAEEANNAGADMLLSIHFNSGGRGVARGIETYYYQSQADIPSKINQANHNNPERLEKSKKLALKVQQNLLYQTGASDRGVKRASFAVLRETSIPSILVELGFLDNPEELSKIRTSEYQDRLANGIVDGIIAYYK